MILSNSSLLKLSKCDNSLNFLAVESAKESPYEFIVTHGHRTIEEQKRLYAQGRTEPGKKVTNCDGVKKKSKHNYTPSKAFDIAIKIDGQITWEEKYYIEVAAHIKEVAKKNGIKITWGGDFKNFPDLPHYEI